MSQPPNELPLPHEDVSARTPPNNDEAVNLIRQKVSRLYGSEPSAEAEEQEIEAVGAKSKHQQFIARLMSSGKTLVEIQTAWHLYYQNLPDNEKREVWQEFYANHARSTRQSHSDSVKVPEQIPNISPKKMFETVEESQPQVAKGKTAHDIKQTIIKHATGGKRLKRRHHVQSLLFGLGMGFVVVFIFMFGFFNERFIAPFISPSKTASSAPVIIDPNAGNSVGPENKVIIPKINVDVPVVYDVPSISEKDLQSALERGVVHYPQSPVPGQNGNVVVVGHSSNNIFNHGKYKFAFVMLNRLEEGDTFMLNYGGQRYVYKVYAKKIVRPTDVAVLGPTDKTATATLITCDPPGTALNRLVIIGEQISPSPNSNIAATSPSTAAQQPAILPGNAESLFQRLFGWLSN